MTQTEIVNYRNSTGNLGRSLPNQVQDTFHIVTYGFTVALSRLPLAGSIVSVQINGQWIQGSHYSIVGQVLTFLYHYSFGDVVRVVYEV